MNKTKDKLEKLINDIQFKKKELLRDTYLDLIGIDEFSGEEKVSIFELMNEITDKLSKLQEIINKKKDETTGEV